MRGGGQQGVGDAGGGGAVVQVAEPGTEGVVRLAVAGGGGLRVAQRLDDLLGVGEERSGGAGLEVEVEAAQGVAVVVEVPGVEEHGAPGLREVEHQRGVVGDQDVADEEEFGDVRVPADVADVVAAGDRAADQVVAADQQDVAVAEFGGGPGRVEGEVEGVPAAALGAVLAPGRGVEDDGAVLGDGEAAADPGGALGTAVGVQQVVAGVAGLQDGPGVAEGVAQDRRGEPVRRDQQ